MASLSPHLDDGFHGLFPAGLQRIPRRRALGAAAIGAWAWATVAAEPSATVWDFSSPERTPDPGNGLRIRLRDDVTTPDGEPVLEMVSVCDSHSLAWTAHINCWTNCGDNEHQPLLTATFWARGDADSTLAVRAVNEGHWPVSPLTVVRLTGPWQTCQYRGRLRRPTRGWVSLPRISLAKAAAGQAFLIGPVRAICTA